MSKRFFADRPSPYELTSMTVHYEEVLSPDQTVSFFFNKACNAGPLSVFACGFRRLMMACHLRHLFIIMIILLHLSVSIAYVFTCTFSLAKGPDNFKTWTWKCLTSTLPNNYDVHGAVLIRGEMQQVEGFLESALNPIRLPLAGGLFGQPSCFVQGR